MRTTTGFIGHLEQIYATEQIMLQICSFWGCAKLHIFKSGTQIRMWKPWYGVFNIAIVRSD